MSIFDEKYDQVNSFFSDWIKINDNKSKWTIEDFPYKQGVDENLTKPHCWKCVTVNNCWFKNESDKKPEHFNYSTYSLSEIPSRRRGLYHPNCHCKELPINVPSLPNIVVLDLRANMNDFFSKKKNVFYGMGYTYKDEKEIISMYEEQIKTLYRNGNYTLYKHWKYGYQVNFIITIYGKGQFRNKSHRFKSGIIIFPNGKVRIATVFAGRID